MTECEELIAEIRANIASKKIHNAAMLETLKKLLYRNEAVSERYLVKGYTIPKNDYYDVPAVSSPEYERARIFCSIGFNENTTAGIEIDLYYSGHYIGNILKVIGTKAGASAGSEAFDINQLSGFTLKVRNKDLSEKAVVFRLYFLN